MYFETKLIDKIDMFSMHRPCYKKQVAEHFVNITKFYHDEAFVRNLREIKLPSAKEKMVQIIQYFGIERGFLV